MINYIFEGIAIFLHCIVLGIILFAIYEIALFVMKKRKDSDYGKENILQLLCELFLAIYICTILQITGIIGRTYSWNLSCNALQNLINIPFQGASIKMVTLNCLLFVPYGFLVTILKHRSKISWWKLFFIGFGTSFMIEFMQAFTGRLPEVDDLIANTAGFVAGAVIASGFLEFRNQSLRKSGLKKIILTVAVFFVSLFALSFWANGDKLQEKEDAYYERYSFNTENYAQISKFGVWKSGKCKMIGKEASEAEDWYSWIGDDISNHSAHYKVKDKQSSVESVIDKNKVYIEIEYKKAQSFKFYNNKSWKMNQVACILFCVEDGTLWYGGSSKNLEKCARYDSIEDKYQVNTQLLDELNEWMTNEK